MRGLNWYPIGGRLNWRRDAGGVRLACFRGSDYCPIVVNCCGHRPVDWTASLLVGMLIVFVVSWSLMLYASWGIGGAFAYPSWKQAYFYFTNSVEITCVMAVSFLSLVGLALAFWAKGRSKLAAVAFVAVAVEILALLTLPALN